MSVSARIVAALLAEAGVEAREGIAVVFAPDGRYLGCVGVARWVELVAEEDERRRVEEAAA